MKNDKLYKGHYCITFYDKTDSFVVKIFDNVKDILQFEGEEITRTNVIRKNSQLYKAFKSEEHFTFLKGECCRVYLVDVS